MAQTPLTERSERGPSLLKRRLRGGAARGPGRQLSTGAPERERALDVGAVQTRGEKPGVKGVAGADGVDRRRAGRRPGLAGPSRRVHRRAHRGRRA